MTPKKRTRSDSPSPGIALTVDDTLLETLQIGSVFKEQFTSTINSVDFHREEDYLVTACDDDCIQLFDVYSAKHLKTVSSRKYGCRCVTYTHHPNCILVGSAKGDSHAIRYLSLHDNRWLRYFDGHSEKVTSISMSPANDTFISAAEDQEVRLWDLRTPNCQAMVKCPGLPCCAFDQQGLVFSISSNCGVVKLFDVRGFEKGPFATFAVKDENCSVVPFSCLKFSYDGQKILAVNEGNVYVIEAFEGHVLMKLNVGTPQGGVPLEASFTPDASHVISACYDRKIRIWSIEANDKAKSKEPPKELVALEGHTGPVTCVKWAPRTSLMASACSNLALWIPDIGKIYDMNSLDCLTKKQKELEEGSG